MRRTSRSSITAVAVRTASVWLCSSGIRFLGTFGSDLSRVPVNTQWFVARQLGITDITILSRYAQRETTRREHQALIRHQYAYREWTWPWSFRLSRLLYTRSWISNRRPSLLFDWATGWLIQHKIPFAGCFNVDSPDFRGAQERRPTNRLWLRLSALPTPGQITRLETTASGSRGFANLSL